MQKATGKLLLSALALACAALSAQQALALGLPPAGPALTAPRVSPDPRVVDLGVAAPGETKTFTVTLAARNKAALEAFVASLANPASPNYRQFITPQQFAASYGQTPAAVAQVVAYLRSQGFTISQVHANKLLVTAQGTNAQIAAAFGTSIHGYSLLGVNYEAPATAAVLPAALSGVVTGVTGLSTKPNYHTNTVVVPNTGALAGDAPTTVAAIGGVPGQYTVSDLAAKYNINPLYGKGLTGAGRTIGIVTLAGYNQSDAYAYWGALGLPVSPGRITDVPVDGGALAKDGPGSEGSGESTLDVEQSGGVAPGANMRVYIGPNAGSGFLDAFAQAVEDDLSDTISISWGSPEIAVDGGTLDGFHSLLLEAASFGIPVIAAAGDAAAFDVNRGYTYPNCTTLLSVDHPAADPLVLAAGGTTLPNTVQHKYGPVTVPTERAWGWDYLRSYMVNNYGNSLYYASYYTVGGGGGVSVNFSLPSYQSGLAGVQKSASAQSLVCSSAFLKIAGNGFYDLIDMPSGFAGRNLPDVSLNADPYSGYLVYQGGWGAGSGGTSFVAPQLNGILTLISSGLPGRVGLINPQLYGAFQKYGYGAGSPFKAISSGDNEFYPATPTYNPATGLGSLDVTALAAALGVQ
ncbi:MAG: S8/S53 family peptidase [Pelomonas sp.]|nr:S8/S53 family peptidase [Roseateles sp.]